MKTPVACKMCIIFFWISCSVELGDGYGGGAVLSARHIMESTASDAGEVVLGKYHIYTKNVSLRVQKSKSQIGSI